MPVRAVALFDMPGCHHSRAVNTMIILWRFVVVTGRILGVVPLYIVILESKAVVLPRGASGDNFSTEFG